jgi:hypothetical protein
LVIGRSSFGKCRKVFPVGIDRFDEFMLIYKRRLQSINHEGLTNKSQPQASGRHSESACPIDRLCAIALYQINEPKEWSQSQSTPVGFQRSGKNAA